MAAELADDTALDAVDMADDIADDAVAVPVLLAHTAAVGRLVTPAGIQMLSAYLMVAVMSVRDYLSPTQAHW